MSEPCLGKRLGNVVSQTSWEQVSQMQFLCVMSCCFTGEESCVCQCFQCLKEQVRPVQGNQPQGFPRHKYAPHGEGLEQTVPQEERMVPETSPGLASWWCLCTDIVLQASARKLLPRSLPIMQKLTSSQRENDFHFGLWSICL